MSTPVNSFSANDLRSASEQMFISLTRSAPVGIYRTDAHGNCYYVNDRWCQIAGLTSMEAEGFGWVNGIHPSDRELVSAEWNASVEEIRPFSLEYRFQNKSGQITWAFGQAVSEQNETGEIIGYVGTITDISDRKATEQALKLQRDFNQLIAEISSRFIDISRDRIDAEIERTLQLIGEATNSDTSYLIEFSIPDRSDLLLPDGTVSMTHEWTKPQYPRQIALVQNVPLSVFPWSNAKLLRREIVNMTGVTDAPIEAAIDQTSWKQFNIVSVLSVPMIQKSVVTGTMGFASFSDVVIWDEEIIRLLQVMAQTIANAQQRARDEQQLYESEERLRLALKSANQGLYDLNLQTGEVITSLEYATMLGYSPATFQETNAKWIERLHPDDRERVAKVYQDYIAGIVPEYKVEFRQYTQTGEWKWILSHGKIVSWDEAGNPLRMLGTHTDISDRKYAEEQAQHRLDILEAARDIISSIDFTGKVTYLNQAGRALLGLTPDEDVSQTHNTDYHSPEMADFILQEAIPQCIQNGFWAGETLFRRRDGSEFPVLQVIVSHCRQDGSISHFSTIARDISDRKQAEAARLQTEKLRLELTLLEQILDIILAGYWDWDLPNNQEYLSPGFKRMFGYADDEMPNSPKSWQCIIFEEDLPKVLECFDRHTQSHGEVPFYNEVRYRHKDGSTIWVICSGQVIEWDQAGNPMRMIGCHIDITQRKQLEMQLMQQTTALQASEATNRATLEAIPDLLLRLRRDGTCVEYIRPGIRSDNFLPVEKHVSEVLPPELLQNQLQIIEQAILTKELNVYEHQFLKRDLMVYEEIRIVAINDQEVLAIVRDISDRKLSEEKLRKSDIHLKMAQRIGKLGSWEFDPYTDQIVWSDEVFHIFGRDPAMGTPSFDELQQQIHPDDRAYHQQVVQTAIATIQPYDLEVRFYRSDGSLGYFFAKGEPIVDAKNQFTKLIGTVLDITDRKQAEEKLKTLSDRLTLAIKSGNIGIWDWNVTENILTWDDRMYELYGIKPNQFTSVYDAWASSLHPDDRTVTELAIQQALTGEKDYDPEFRIVHPDGTIRFIQGYAFVQRNAQGEAIRMIGLNIDNTNQKRAEAKLRETSAQLSASNRELEAFAYSVSHDLRSPLRAIDGFSKALLEDYGDKFDADGKDYFDRIRSNVARMGTLIDDLLSLSRVSRSEIEYRKVNLSILVQEQLDELQTTDPQRQVEIAIAPNVWVSADSTLMRVVISNLIQNAWKFTSHHATARIEFGMLDSENQQENQQENEQFTYFIRDNGAGFDMNYVKKLFGVFQRLHNTNEFAGTGIGLATVQRAIHRHGGRVWAEGAVEKGATIYFTLPNSSSQELK